MLAASRWVRAICAAAAAPSADVTTIAEAALRVIDRFELDRPIRLLGVRLEFAAE